MKLLSKGIIAIILLSLATAGWLIANHHIVIPQPQGLVAMQERNLIIFSISLMLLIIIPSVLLTFFVAWKFRASNTNEEYQPEAQANKVTEVIWWVIPFFVVVVLASLTWITTHALDPYRVLKSNVKPITIQVISLRWKWLFIYPDQNIATVNYIQFPVNTPINFELTADSPMNSFWIPQLAGQIYAMNGMSTQLHLLASKTGIYPGSTAEISGDGFADMRFNAKVTSQSDFENWVKVVKKRNKPFTVTTYNILYVPSENTRVTFYSSVEKDMYKKILLQYMRPENALHK